MTGFDKITEKLKHEDSVMGCVLSGAGPSVLVISQKNGADKVRDIIKETWKDLDINAKVITLPIEQNGAKVVSIA